MPRELASLGTRCYCYRCKLCYSLVCSIVTVLSFAGAVVTAVDDAVSAHSSGCEYIIVESKDEAATLGGNHVPFDWIIAVLCIGYVQPLVSSLVSTSQVQTPVAQRSSRSAIKRACAVETVLVEKPPSATKRSRATDLSPTYDGHGGVKCRSNQTAPGPLVPASINTASPRSPVSPSEQAASSHIVVDTKKKASFSPRHSKTGGSISASPGHAAPVIPSCFRLFDLKSKACVRFVIASCTQLKVISMVLTHTAFNAHIRVFCVLAVTEACSSPERAQEVAICSNSHRAAAHARSSHTRSSMNLDDFSV